LTSNTYDAEMEYDALIVEIDLEDVIEYEELVE
jgi:hypothetical protein